MQISLEHQARPWQDAEVLWSFPTFNSSSVPETGLSQNAPSYFHPQFLFRNRLSQLNRELRLSTAGDNRKNSHDATEFP